MTLTTFIHLKSYEHIVHQIRRHYITIVPAGIIFIALLGVPLVVRWLFFTLYPSLQNFADVYPTLFPIVVLGTSIYYLSILLFGYSYFINFYLDLLIVSNDRLVYIEQASLFARTISEVDLYKIQDITSEVKGFFASLFNYGSILIQTAGAVDKFTILYAPHPEALRQEILDLAEADRQYHTTEAK